MWTFSLLAAVAVAAAEMEYKKGGRQAAAARAACWMSFNTRSRLEATR
jgi:hypothetical protein